MRSLCCFIIILFSNKVAAQRIDNFSTLFHIDDSIYGQIRYDNDLIQRKDEYYSQGISANFIHPALNKNPLNYLFVKFNSFNKNKYGIELIHSVFTPTSIHSDSVLTGDRPFAAIIATGFFKTSMDVLNKRQLSSEIYIGFIGPAALGKEMQTSIHRWTNNDIPHGWQHQIKNAPIVNYDLEFEQQLFSYASLFSIAAKARLNTGTYVSNTRIGLDFHFGQKNNVYSSIRKKYQYYLYGQSSIKFMAYDASLMGGIINRNTSHLNYAQLTSIIFEQHVGIVFTVPHFYFGVDFGFISKEIKKGKQHGWGGVRIGFN